MQLMKSYKSSYKCSVIHENSHIVADNFSCILFQNMGTAIATVNGIKIEPNTCLSLNEDPGVTINTDFLIEFFPQLGETVEMNVIQTYYKESRL